MQSGRTSPALFGCVLDGGDEEEDFVVKLKGGRELTTTGLVCEVIAAELATYFGIAHPAPALIEVDGVLAKLVAGAEPGKAALMRGSVGMNFGSALLNNLITWPVDRRPSASQFDDAAAIFAFDVLIQNPDRRYNNPNLGTVGDALTIFDHELAFSFHYDVLPSAEPWNVSTQGFWSDHVLFSALRRKVLQLGEFTERLAQLPVHFVDEVREQLPGDWDLSVIPPVKRHLSTLSAHALEFEEQLRLRLV